MWISNQNNIFAITEVRCINLCRWNGIEWKNCVPTLTLESSGIQMDSSRISLITKSFEKLTLDCWVGQSRKLCKLLLTRFESHIQLALDKNWTLLRKHLSRDLF